ncbi:MAG: DUF1992 domain-containing protein [Bryobacterales bacterium]|nr:DUF1992 domain-containing protein [Bryobacterales bacterium]
MDIAALIAERKIQEAMEEGLFENLAGKGRELDLSENPFETPEARMGNRLLRNNGFVPAWVAESKDIDEAREQLLREREAAAGDPWTVASLAPRIAALNRRITLFNMKAPGPGQQKAPF